MTIVVDWNGNDLPEELRTVPRGRYVLVPVELEEELSSEQEQGILAALTSAREHGIIPVAEVRRAINEILGR